MLNHSCRGNTGFASCESPVSTFLSTDEYLILSNVCSCWKTPHLIYSGDLLTLNSPTALSIPRAWRLINIRISFPRHTTAFWRLGTLGSCSTALQGHLTQPDHPQKAQQSGRPVTALNRPTKVHTCWQCESWNKAGSPCVTAAGSTQWKGLRCVVVLHMCGGARRHHACGVGAYRCILASRWICREWTRE